VGLLLSPSAKWGRAGAAGEHFTPPESARGLGRSVCSKSQHLGTSWTPGGRAGQGGRAGGWGGRGANR
jgi:hypothetical protein